MPAVVFYTSAHGLGHISRDVEVIHALAARRPDTRVVVRTSAPEWFIKASLRVPAEVHAIEVDTGIVQPDSLTVDIDLTVKEAARFYQTFDQRAAREARELDALGAGAVVGDVPPLAFAAAHQAGVPSVMLANFTWDWIYAAYPQFERVAPGVIDAIREAYAKATIVLRLPMAGGFEPVLSRARDIPLIARRSRVGRGPSRERLGVGERDRVVLASFGRYGMALPYAHVVQDDDLTLIVTTESAGGARTHSADTRGRVLELSTDDLAAHDLRYEDLVAAADVVVSKPGYGIVSECAANGTALLYAARGAFIEEDLLVREMPRLVRCRPFAHDRLMSGKWSDDVNAILAQPPMEAASHTNGADVTADAILEALKRVT